MEPLRGHFNHPYWVWLLSFVTGFCYWVWLPSFGEATLANHFDRVRYLGSLTKNGTSTNTGFYWVWLPSFGETTLENHFDRR